MDFARGRLWHVFFEVHRQLAHLPVPYAVVEEVQTLPGYRLDGVNRNDNGGQISITLAGEGVLRINGKEHALTPGKAFMHCHRDPAVSYYYPPSGGGEPWRFLWVSFCDEYSAGLFRELSERHGYLYDIGVDSPLVGKLAGFKSSASQVRLLTPLEGGALCFELLSMLLASSERAIRMSPRGAMIARVQNMIAASPAARLDGESIARSFGISREHLLRVFKEQTGDTLYAYLTRTRLREAVDMLLQTGLSGKEIAERCGFSEYSIFYRTFKRHTGMSPEQLRSSGFRPRI